MTIPFWPRPSPARLWAEAAFAATMRASRDPALYGPGRTPDTVDGRFELLVLHAGAAFIRLKRAPEDRRGRLFADRFFLGLDDSLRELGVGVLTVPRRMRKLADKVYGRLGAYERAQGESEAALAASIARNVFDADAAPFAPTLARRYAACVAAFADAPLEALAEPSAWPAVESA